MAKANDRSKMLHGEIEHHWLKQCGSHACGCDEWPECVHTLDAYEMRRLAMEQEQPRVRDGAGGEGDPR
jgi:hypothetical protein